MPNITPCLWFDGKAEEAAKFYTSVFKNSRVGKVTRYTTVGPGPEGSALTVQFELDGQSFVALNGGPTFKFNEAVSFVVDCENQEEIDEYWTKLTAGGGAEVECGWLRDKYGLSWQIVPTELNDMVSDPDGEKADRVMRAMMKMKKLDIQALEEAFEHEPAGRA